MTALPRLLGGDFGGRFTPLLCLTALLAWGSPGAASLAQDGDAPVFARVGDDVVTLADYQSALQRAVRGRFYHGTVPRGEMARFQREVGADLVDRVLLLQEADRRRVEPDRDWVQARLDGYDQRYGTSPRWQSERDRLLPELGRALESQSRLHLLEERVRSVTPPDEATLRAYYAANPDKFTEPERFRASVILLRVEPSAPKAVWEAARAEAAGILARLRAGDDFAEIARLRSGDGSASVGGDMGYLHRGMLGDQAQVALDALAPGEIGEPVVLLEGVAIFRLDERPERALLAFDEVRERSRGLWLREHGDRAWNDLLARLRTDTAITVHEEHYLPLEDDADPSGTTGTSQ
jgi:hypothetical protein